MRPLSSTLTFSLNRPPPRTLLDMTPTLLGKELPHCLSGHRPIYAAWLHESSGKLFDGSAGSNDPAVEFLAFVQKLQDQKVKRAHQCAHIQLINDAAAVINGPGALVKSMTTLTMKFTCLASQTTTKRQLRS